MSSERCHSKDGIASSNKGCKKTKNPNYSTDRLLRMNVEKGVQKPRNTKDPQGNKVHNSVSAAQDAHPSHAQTEGVISKLI